jgi:hypothetical protein
MIVHEVRVGESGHQHPFTNRHRTVYVGSADSDIKYRDMLVYFRHRWELYTDGYLNFVTCDDQLSRKEWRRETGNKIRHSDGVMMIVSEHTVKDENALWQIDYAVINKTPIVGVDIRNNFEGDIPEKLVGKMTKYGWEWFAEFINRL